MPRGRPKSNPDREDRNIHEQASAAEQGQTGEQASAAEQTPTAELEQTSPPEPEAEHPAPAGHETPESSAQEAADETAHAHAENIPDPEESLREESSDALPGYMAENLREDIRTFMQNFGINGHSPESVCAAITEFAIRIREEQAVTGIQAGHGEQIPAPDEQRNPIPLNVRIASLEMDGDTRAFAAAEYGDLTVNRIRVKQDEYGALSAAMPKFRQTGGWKEICSFNSVESRNRLTGAVLDAYGQTLAQLQGQARTSVGAHEQNAGEAQEAESDQEQSELRDFEEQESGGPIMGMSRW
jgi:DNA-binding cell septation regulator SpoVG